MRVTPLLTGCTTLLLLGSILSTAQARMMFATERELLVDVPLVVTASRLQQSQAKAPASVTVIDRAMIDASTAIDIPDLLRLVPGMQVTYANGHLYSVMYHGSETAWSRRMQVLVDGRSVYNPMFSIVPWHHLDIDIEDIERIEVIRGPNAPTYGSNAFRGAVNIITRQPFLDQGVTVKAMAGSLETRRLMGRSAGSSGNLDYRVTFSHEYEEGFEDVNDHRRLDMVSFRGVYSATTNDTIDIQLGMTDGPIGGWGMSPQTSPVREIASRSGHASIRWNHSVSAGNEVQLHLYHNYLDWHDLYETATLSELFSALTNQNIAPEQIPLLLGGVEDQSFLVSRFHGKGTRTDIEWQQSLIPAEHWRMVWGFGMRRDTLNSTSVLGYAGSKEDYTRRLFGHAEWDVTRRLGVSSGLMIEDNDIIGTHLSPRLAANYTLRPNHTLRAVATRAVRSPSIYEANEFNMVRFDNGEVFWALYVSDPDLRNESINSYEIGYRGLFVDGRVDFDLKVYQERLRNLIYHARDRTYPDVISTITGGGPFVHYNGGNADVTGAEFQLRIKPWQRALVSLQYGYVDIDGTLVSDVEDFVTGELTPLSLHPRFEESVPRHTASVLLSHGISRNWQASVAWFHLGDTDWAGDGQNLRGYNRWDARLTRNFSGPRVRSDISLIVQNLGDRTYSEFRRENEFDRRVYLQFRART